VSSAFEQLVGVPPFAGGPSCHASLRVSPGHPEDSLLWRKVAPGIEVCGLKMPKNGKLSQAGVDAIYQWIAAGAPR
jgi:hypothetical protein